MINKKSKLSISRQCQLLSINRSSFSYQPILSPNEIEESILMQLIDEIYTRRPFLGSRRTKDELKDDQDLVVNRKKIQRLMRKMGIQAIYPKPRPSKPGKGHKIYP